MDEILLIIKDIISQHYTIKFDICRIVYDAAAANMSTFCDAPKTNDLTLRIFIGSHKILIVINEYVWIWSEVFWHWKIVATTGAPDEDMINNIIAFINNIVEKV